MRAAAASVILAVSGLGVTATIWTALPDSIRARMQEGTGVAVPYVPNGPAPSIDAAPRTENGRRLLVPEGGDLQAALDAAQPADVIALEAGATYQGPFRLPRKSGDDWITVTTASSDELPPEGERVLPTHAAFMPKLRASSGAVVTAEAGSHHYRFVGIEFAPADGHFLYALVQLGDDERDRDHLPHHFVFDRCYLRGDPRAGTRRGIAMNSRDTVVVNSYLADFKEVGADSQAIAGWNGPGPFTISNNYLEAAGENVMFGGADPSIPDLVPSDIEITRNHFAKPLRWKKDHPDFEGKVWTVKNLFELKNARRVLVDGNLFEYNWPAAQNGFAILFTVRNQDGGAPWSVVEDVTFSNNVVRHVASAVNILGHDDNHPSRQTRRITIRNNLFLDIGGDWGSGTLFQLLDGTAEVTIEHNTAFQTGHIVFGGDHAPHARFRFENNVVRHARAGITASGTGSVERTLAQFFPDAVVQGNLIIGGDPTRYPRNNSFPRADEIRWQGAFDAPAGLALPARFAGTATDGGDPGADLRAIADARAAASDGDDEADQADDEEATAGALPTIPGNAPVLVFWISVLLLVYVYAGYPCLAWIRASLRPRQASRSPLTPSVTVIVAAYNEAGRVAARIDNLLSLDYPADKLEVLVGSDGSTDATVREAGRFAGRGVTIVGFAGRRGKPAVINDLVSRAAGELVVFADARQSFEPGALRSLTSYFADPTVGAVSGELILTGGRGGTTAGRGAAFYWRYEKFIRSCESRAGSTVGATGAIYAIRRSLFEPIPADTILDDVLVPVRIARRGYRVLLDGGARAYDGMAATAEQEYIRKVRTIAGTFQLFSRERWLLDPIRNPLWFETVSHKALRLVIPVLHVALFAASIALVAEPLYQAAATLQTCFYAAAAMGHAGRNAPKRPLVLSVPYAICLLSWATVAGFIRFATSSQPVTWERSAPALRS